MRGVRYENLGGGLTGDAPVGTYPTLVGINAVRVLGIATTVVFSHEMLAPPRPRSK